VIPFPIEDRRAFTDECNALVDRHKRFAVPTRVNDDRIAILRRGDAGSDGSIRSPPE
jgi:hypothetical protein